MNASRNLLERRAAVVPRGLVQLNDVTVARATGGRLTDLDGREWIDFASGIGVMSAGHCNESVARAVAEQVALLQHACIHVATYEPYVTLCERLIARFPHGGPTRALLVNTGAEAVENAIKIARQATGRPAVICFTGAFHGRTLLGMTLTSKVGYKKRCGPFAPEVYRVLFPHHYRRGGGVPMAEFVERELERLRRVFVNTIAADEVAAILVEPVQGEGGFIPAPFEWLRGIRKICDEHGILLVLDEVQTGFCRTGRWAAFEHSGVIPDLSTWAKAMGGGLPIAAVLGKESVMNATHPGTLGGTYGGNPVACASALATIDLLEAQDANRRATALGERFRERLTGLRDACPAIGDVRGLGAMQGIEFVEDGDPLRPATERARRVLAACLDEGLLVIGAGPDGNVVRFLPPLLLSDEDLEAGLAILEGALRREAGPA